MLIKRRFLRQSEDLFLQLYCKDKKILLKGVYGSFFFSVCSKLSYSKTEKKIFFVVSQSTFYSFVNLSMILLIQASIGVLLGYRKKLKIVGIGYSAQMTKRNTLVLKLGFSHNVCVNIPSNLVVLCPKPREILLKGIHFQKVVDFACLLRRVKLPSSYKEKGIYFLGERVLLKQGKKT